MDPRLRKDVRFLTTLLGQVILEQEGKGFFEKVETIRLLSKSIRQNSTPHPHLELEKERFIHSLTLDESYKIARAFTLYFQLVNLAEESHRIRRIREYQKSPDTLQEMSLRKLFHDLKQLGIPYTKLRRFLEHMQVELVLTAHPTEAKRMTILLHLLRMSQVLFERENNSMTLQEQLSSERNLKSMIEILWQTQEVRQRPVRVEDEVENTLFYFDRTILELVPRFYETLKSELYRNYPDEYKEEKFSFLKFGSWVGGDRDGNPYVTPKITYQTINQHRGLILRHYQSKIQELIRLLSQSQQIVHVSEELEQAIKEEQRLFASLSRRLRRYESSEKYRRYLSFIHQRLENTLASRTPRYGSAGEFLEALKKIQESLKKHHGALTAQAMLGDLISQVETFGFHLAALDIRDHAEKFRLAAQELLGEELTEESLSKGIHQPKPLRARRSKCSREARKVFSLFDTIHEIQSKVDANAIQEVIISMVREPKDVLAVLLLAKVSACLVHIVPLLETIEDLEKGEEFLKTLLSIPVYRKHLAARGDFQELMLGYSDSNKDGGYLAANWKLYQEQKSLGLLAEKEAIILRLFHGKGGTIDRGGGQSHRAIIAQPFAAQQGRIRITEQGEVVSLKYSNPIIAQRNLEQLISAVIWTNLGPQPRKLVSEEVKRWEDIMNDLAKISYDYYHSFIYETPQFRQYYVEATPIDLLELFQIGSRPAHRTGKKDGLATQGIEDLRAIPWVFSWVQSRHILSAWYGAGYALEEFVEREGEKGLVELQKMHRHWPFFQSLLENLQTSLVKTDMEIARLYANLVQDEWVRRKIFVQIEQEYQRTEQMLLKITGAKDLLSAHPAMRESIALRNPYVDPLNFLQVRFLHEWRKGGITPPLRKKIQEILSLTINGIAFGMKSTG